GCGWITYPADTEELVIVAGAACGAAATSEDQSGTSQAHAAVESIGSVAPEWNKRKTASAHVDGVACAWRNRNHTVTVARAAAGGKRPATSATGPHFNHNVCYTVGRDPGVSGRFSVLRTSELLDTANAASSCGSGWTCGTLRASIALGTRHPLGTVGAVFAICTSWAGWTSVPFRALR